VVSCYEWPFTGINYIFFPENENLNSNVSPQAIDLAFGIKRSMEEVFNSATML